ncbi:MAG: DUF6249 domain-containing protein [Bacteroidota bacterium]
MGPIVLLSVVIITFIVCIFFVWYFQHRAKTKERIVLLEKGVDVEKIFTKEQPSQFSWLKAGIVAIGLGVAFGFHAILGMLSVHTEPLYLFVLFVCVGASLIIAHYVGREKDKR